MTHVWPEVEGILAEYFYSSKNRFSSAKTPLFDNIKFQGQCCTTTTLSFTKLMLYLYLSHSEQCS